MFAASSPIAPPVDLDLADYPRGAPPRYASPSLPTYRPTARIPLVRRFKARWKISIPTDHVAFPSSLDPPCCHPVHCHPLHCHLFISRDRSSHLADTVSHQRTCFVDNFLRKFHSFFIQRRVRIETGATAASAPAHGGRRESQAGTCAAMVGRHSLLHTPFLFLVSSKCLDAVSF